MSPTSFWLLTIIVCKQSNLDSEKILRILYWWPPSCPQHVHDVTSGAIIHVTWIITVHLIITRYCMVLPIQSIFKSLSTITNSVTSPASSCFISAYSKAAGNKVASPYFYTIYFLVRISCLKYIFNAQYACATRFTVVCIILRSHAGRISLIWEQHAGTVWGWVQPQCNL